MQEFIKKLSENLIETSNHKQTLTTSDHTSLSEEKIGLCFFDIQPTLNLLVLVSAKDFVENRVEFDHPTGLLKFNKEPLLAINDFNYHQIPLEVFSPNDLLSGVSEQKTILLKNEIELIVFKNPNNKDYWSTKDLNGSKNREAHLAELHTAKKNAEEASKIKSQFLATMSHEIRTPLNGIIGYLDILKDTEMTFEQREYIKTIEVCGNSLLTLVNDILDLSRIESNQIELDSVPFDLNDLMIEANKIIQSRIVDRNVYLILDMPKLTEYYYGDSYRIKQILVNLLGNSAKFTHRGFIRSGFTVNNDNNTITFFIEDTGIGMTPDQLLTLFEPFKQADKSITRKYGGTGLGMSISKNLLDLMGGKASVTSEIKKGTRVEFVLPAIFKGALWEDEPYKYPHNISIDSHLLNIAPEVKKSFDKHCDHVQSVNLLELNPESLAASTILMLDYEKFLHLQNANKNLFAEMTERNRKNEIKLCVCIQYASPVILHNLKKHDVYDYIQWPIWEHNVLRILKEVGAKSVLKSDRKKAFSLNKLSILVAEDDTINQRLIANIIKSIGHKIELAGNGEEAVEMCRHEEFDLILMDMQMPKMDGITATKEIREFNKEIPIVALTANAFQGDRENCLSIGMNDFLPKPVVKKDVITMIEKFTPSAFTHTMPDLTRALIVEDNAHLSRIFLKHLTHKFEKVAFESAWNGVEACAKLGSFLPDLIITDLTMPKMDGIELIKFLRSNERYKHIHIIIFTATDINESLEETVKTLDVDAVFSKKTSIDNIIEYINENFRA